MGGAREHRTSNIECLNACQQALCGLQALDVPRWMFPSRQNADLAFPSAAGYHRSMEPDTISKPANYDDIRPDVSHLVTEDDTPLDNQFSEKQMHLLVEALHTAWNPGVPFVAIGNVGVFFALNAPPLVPDVLVSLDVEEPPGSLHLKENRSYFVWNYGKPPDLVIEIVSNDEGGELSRKMRGYAKIGVPYYVVFDPVHHIQETDVQCFHLQHEGATPRYQPLAEPRFPDLGLGLVLWEGEYRNRREEWLRWVDAEGKLIANAKEYATVAEQQLTAAERQAATAQQQAAAAQQQAAAAQQQAAAAQQQAAAAQQQAAALAAKLRSLGIDPDTITP